MDRLPRLDGKEFLHGGPRANCMPESAHMLRLSGSDVGPFWFGFSRGLDRAGHVVIYIQSTIHIGLHQCL